MQLAGEAGSLLKIEEEIREVVEHAREEFNRALLYRKEVEGYLLPEVAPKRQPTLFDFADLPDRTRFWDRAEQEILEALRCMPSRQKIHRQRKSDCLPRMPQRDLLLLTYAEAL